MIVKLPTRKKTKAKMKMSTASGKTNHLAGKDDMVATATPRNLDLGKVALAVAIGQTLPRPLPVVMIVCGARSATNR